MEKNKSFSYWIIGFVAFLEIVFALSALFVLVVSGFQSQVDLLFFSEGTFYIPASVFFSISVLANALCFGFFCQYLVSDIKKAGAEKNLLDLKEEIKRSEKRIKTELEERFAKLSVEQFMTAQTIKDAESKITEKYAKIENLLQEHQKYEILHKPVSPSRAKGLSKNRNNNV